MLQAILIGYLGGDAETKVSDGREFTTFRVAHTDRWKDANGNERDSTQWIDCVLDGKPNVTQYLKRGTLVYVSGHCKTRIYSSAKDRCMKAGLSVSVRQIELIGGKADPMPTQIVTEDGVLHQVTKWYYCQDLVRTNFQPEFIQVMNPKGNDLYNVDRKGFIYPVQPAEDSSNQQEEEQQGAQVNHDTNDNSGQ